MPTQHLSASPTPWSPRSGQSSTAAPGRERAINVRFPDTSQEARRRCRSPEIWQRTVGARWSDIACAESTLSRRLQLCPLLKDRWPCPQSRPSTHRFDPKRASPVELRPADMQRLRSFTHACKRNADCYGAVARHTETRWCQRKLREVKQPQAQFTARCACTDRSSWARTGTANPYGNIDGRDKQPRSSPCSERDPSYSFTKSHSSQGESNRGADGVLSFGSTRSVGRTRKASSRLERPRRLERAGLNAHYSACGSRITFCAEMGSFSGSLGHHSRSTLCRPAT